MSNEELTFGPGPSEVSGPQFEPTQVVPSSQGLSSSSTLSKSDQSVEKQEADASNPTIPIPNQLIQFFYENQASDRSANKIFSLEQSEIISSMLDKWNDSIKELDAKRKEDLLHPTADEVRKSEERHAVSKLIDTVSAAPKDSVFGALVVGTLFVATGGGTKDAMMIDTLSTALVGVNPTSDAAPPINLYTSDMRAELGLLGAAMMQAAMCMARTESVFKGNGQTKAEVELSAKSYADQIWAIVNSGQLTGLIQAIVTQNSDPKKPIDKSLVDTLTNQLKLILLASALTALYKSPKEGGTGKITKEEFLGLIKETNETFGPHKETMEKILSQMRNLLGEKGGAQLELLANFFGSDPALSVLTNPEKLFERLHRSFTIPSDKAV